jgi:hypothetical protein
MKILFRKADAQVRKPRESARKYPPNIRSKPVRRTFDAVAYAAALEVLG